MKSIIVFILIFFLFLFQRNKEDKVVEEDISSKQNKSITKQDSLFKLEIKLNENFVKISPPENSDFELPDSFATIEPYKIGDFNADNKEDVLVYLGACGTGGCMYGLFLNQYNNYYKLALLDYLKNAEFTVEKNGLWTIESSEELEPYNPSKLQITIFKFDRNKDQYFVDTTYVYIDKDVVE